MRRGARAEDTPGGLPTYRSQRWLCAQEVDSAMHIVTQGPAHRVEAGRISELQHRHASVLIEEQPDERT